MLLCTLGATLSGNLLTGKGAMAMNQGRETNMPEQLEQANAQLEQAKAQLGRIFNAASSCLNLMMFIQEINYPK